MSAAMATPARGAAPLPDTGELSATPFPLLLVSLYRERIDGALVLRRDRSQKRLLFQGGAPVAVESNLAGESLVAQLVAAKAVTPEQQERIQELVRKKGCAQGAAVLALGLLEPKELFGALREQLRRCVLECFGWPRGDYQIERDAAPPPDAQPFRTDPYLLVQEGLATHWSPDRLLGELSARLSLYPAPARAFADVRRRLRADPAVEAFVASLDGRRRLDQALGPGANSPPVLAAAWLLDATQALRFSDAPAADDGPGSVAEIEIEVAGSTGAEAASAPGPGDAATSAPTAGGSAAGAGSAVDPAAEKLREEVLERHAKLSELDHYQALGIPQEASAAAVKKAYFQAAKRYHPDTLGRLDLGDIKREAAEVFSLIAKAYDVLSDPKRRQDYDLALAHGGESFDAEALAQAETFYRKGEIMLRMGDFRGALEFLKPAVDIWPEECAYQSALGWAYYKKAPPEPKLALEHLRKAVELDPKDASAHQRLAMVLRETGDADGAAEHTARAKKLDPSLS
jgi:hypothetical protein